MEKNLKVAERNFSNIYNEGFKNNTLFFPSDIGLKYNLLTNKLKAIQILNIEKYEIKYDYIDPQNVDFLELRRDYSIYYYNKDGGFKEIDLVQVLDKKYESIN